MEHFHVTHVLNDIFKKISNYVSVYKNSSYKLQKISPKKELMQETNSPKSDRYKALLQIQKNMDICGYEEPYR